MAVDIAAFFLVLWFGCAAFVFGVLCFLGKTLAMIGRGLGRAFSVSGSPEARPRARPAVRVTRTCPDRECGKREFRSARYCSRCGRRLLDDRV